MASYLTRIAADTLAATLAGQVPAYAALVVSDATDASGKRTAALLLATLDWDNARRYQGRKFDATQAGYPQSGLAPQLGGDTIWDWDDDTLAAVVPGNVLLGVVLQAESILDGKRAKRLDARHDGLSSQAIGTAQEAYVAGLAPVALCRRADLLSAMYGLKQGKLL